jgi:hypothetical protein
VPAPLAVALLDPASRVARVATEVGEHIVPLDEVAAVRQQVQVLKVDELGPAPLELAGRQGRELGVVRLLAETPAALAAGLDLDPAAVVIDPSLGRGWQAAVVGLRGPISGDSVARARARLQEAVDDGANFLCLQIDSAGGAPEQSLVLAGWLASLDPARVRTVAYVPRQARGDAALVALACDELVLGPQAVLGGEGNGGVIDPRVGLVRDSFVAMALVLERMAAGGSLVPLESLVAAFPSLIISKTKVELPASWSAADFAQAFDRIEAAFPGAGCSRLDGIRIDWPEGWLLVRASNTEPIVRIVAESETATDANDAIDRARSALLAS